MTLLLAQATLNKVGLGDDDDKVDGMLEYARTELGLQRNSKIGFEDFQRMLGILWGSS